METLVRERGERPLVWLDGLLPLPIGARIELDDLPTGRADAVVVGVTLVGESRFLALEVELHDAGGAAVEEAQAEEEVVEAAEMITAIN